jgi:hypothetical protein
MTLVIGPQPSRSPELPSRTRGRPLATTRVLAAVAIVAILVGSAFVVYGLPSTAPATGSIAPTGSPAPHAALGETNSAALVGSAAGAASGIRLGARSAGSPSATGRGTFFDDSNLSHPAAAVQPCFDPYSYINSSTCPNTTFDPSINITAGGEIGVAFTTYTNFTHCPGALNISNLSLVDVVFQSSSNGGLTWSPLTYLGNENCSAAANYSDAWEPSLTSLSNGTFVLTYIEYNTSACPKSTSIIFYCEQPYPPEEMPYDVPNSALVVQESYNGGSTWTAPQVLNSTFNATAEKDSCGAQTGSPLYRPWISALGNSVYLAYENITDGDGCNRAEPYTSQDHVMVSTNGGQNWSAPANLPVIGDGGFPLYGEATNFSGNPYILAAPNGQVYVAYATGLEEQLNYCQPSGCYPYGIPTEDVVVANATGGVGPWTLHYAASHIAVQEEGVTDSYFEDPSFGVTPQLAWNGITGQLAMVYSEALVGLFCYPSTIGSPDCYSPEYEQASVFQNSTTGASNWSTPTEIGNLINPYGGAGSNEYYPAIAIDHNGTIDVSLELANESACVTVNVSISCEQYEQLYLNSTDNGTSWNGPVLISPFVRPDFDEAFSGEYETATTAPSGATYYAWTSSVCPSTAYYCYYVNPGSPEPNTTVTVSWLFTGTGVSVTFHESNLTAGLTWSANLLGNTRSALAGANLVVSGVPTTEPLIWSASWVNSSYGIAWQPLASATNPIPPTAITANTTLSFTYAEFVEVTLEASPLLTYQLTPGYNEATYSMSPLPGVTWVPANSTLSVSVTPTPITCAVVCVWVNLTWVAFTGTGPGSVGSNATSVTLHIGTAPVNETANFIETGECEYIFGTLYCYGVKNAAYPLVFHESGLPSGTSWGATVVLNGTVNGTMIGSSSSAWLNMSVGQTAAQFTLWTVLDGTTGNVWVPTSNPESPVREPIQVLVNVSYALVSASTTSFVANVTSAGLPIGTEWSANIGGSSYAVTSGNLTVGVAGGTPVALNGSDVYTENGVGYYASSVSVFPYVENLTWQNSTVLPASYSFDGPAKVVINYSPMFWLTVSASTGGAVGPASRWVQPGAAVDLTATASTGYYFVDWSGLGAGSSSLAQSRNASITIRPTAPVTELATFRVVPPATWNVTVIANGLAPSAGVTFTLGNLSYSSSGNPFNVGGLASGPYLFSAATLYSNSSNGTRWVPTSWYSSFVNATGDILSVTGNGTIWVNYTTQYVLTVAKTANGNVTGDAPLGSNWVDAGTVVALTATPAYHYEFAGWNASGLGSVSGTTPSISVTVGGPVWESASFNYRIFPLPAVFRLNVTEIGLPTGIAWSVATSNGNSSAAGTAATLGLNGLNGSYSLVVPAVYIGLGTRYVANGSVPIPATVTSNHSASVTFVEQFALTIAAGVGGSVVGAGTTWVAGGSSQSLSATASSGYMFVSWNGTGAGQASPVSVTTASSSVTVTGPTNETATFAPVVQQHTSGSSSAGMLPALGLLVALLVVGLIVGLILGTRRSQSPPTSDSGTDGEPAPVEEGAEPPTEEIYGSTPMGSGPSSDGSGDPESPA